MVHGETALTARLHVFSTLFRSLTLGNSTYGHHSALTSTMTGTLLSTTSSSKLSSVPSKTYLEDEVANPLTRQVLAVSGCLNVAAAISLGALVRDRRTRFILLKRRSRIYNGHLQCNRLVCEKEGEFSSPNINQSINNRRKWGISRLPRYGPADSATLVGDGVLPSFLRSQTLMDTSLVL